MKQLVWILEDDVGCQFVLKDILAEYYELRIFSDLREFRESLNLMAGPVPRALIADIRLPDADFSDYLARNDLRKEVEDLLNMAPVIVVSVVDDVELLRWCFRLGVSDYLVKPFKREELIVKLERQIEKKLDRGFPGTVSRSICSLNPYSLSVTHAGLTSPSLTLKEAQVLRVLLDTYPRGKTRKELISTLWENLKVTPKTLDVHIFNLRKKLAEVSLDIHFDVNHAWYCLKPSQKGGTLPTTPLIPGHVDRFVSSSPVDK